MRRPAFFSSLCVAALVAFGSAGAAQQLPAPPVTSAVSDADPEPGTSTPPTAAARANASNRELAVIHYERGRSLYAAGRYREAVVELETAYSLDRTGTNLLLNLGMVHERLGHIDLAILAYQRHMESVSDPAERIRTQRILTRLRGARTELASMSRHHGRADGLFWGVTGGALAATTIGVVMFATQRPGADATPPLVFTATGVSLGVLATVLYFAREAPERRSLFVTAGPTHDGAALGLAGSF